VDDEKTTAAQTEHTLADDGGARGFQAIGSSPAASSSTGGESEPSISCSMSCRTGVLVLVAVFFRVDEERGGNVYVLFLQMRGYEGTVVVSQ
jgi:hypothetical protein